MFTIISLVEFVIFSKKHFEKYFGRLKTMITGYYNYYNPEEQLVYPITDLKRLVIVYHLPISIRRLIVIYLYFN